MFALLSYFRPDTATAAGTLLAPVRWRPLEILFWLVAASLLWLAPSKVLLLNEIAILALFVLSLDLILGYAGIVSLGHGAFLGVGAYAAGLLGKHGFTDPVMGLLIAGAAAGLLGFVTSFLVLRGTDLTKLMVTLGVALILRELANKFGNITGGADGLTGVVMGPVLGLFEFDIFGKTAYGYSLTVLFILFYVARRLVNSPYGLMLRAIKGNSLRTGAMGVPTNHRLVTIYTIAAVYAGIAGALLAQTSQFVSLDVLDFHRSADALLILVLGGSGQLWGAVIGSIAFKIMYDYLAAITPQYWQFWLGLVLVLIVLFGKGGILGFVNSSREWLAHRLGKGAAK
ncbi:branched-chain amino acid ABC transporter permease [Ferrovibrio sp.]|uniref:branched-chain amino acid ABC transporter permease n=1 Tax=Ferrovibrio sp. TaxID=1917215 RepID=UPI000CBF06AB|nr:branched-chain amino acid ABC transporter permease [Ferrovibrio sp.]PJI39267.1 MAG: branched-chain amino acid ABC transporter permease [Ferrovibrio sp.]